MTETSPAKTNPRLKQFSNLSSSTVICSQNSFNEKEVA